MLIDPEAVLVGFGVRGQEPACISQFCRGSGITADRTEPGGRKDCTFVPRHTGTNSRSAKYCACPDQDFCIMGKFERQARFPSNRIHEHEQGTGLAGKKDRAIKAVGLVYTPNLGGTVLFIGMINSSRLVGDRVFLIDIGLPRVPQPLAPEYLDQLRSISTTMITIGDKERTLEVESNMQPMLRLT